MKKGVTLKDIAQKLRMSVSTVSKALSNDPLISEFTKERVQKLAAEWQYVPNEAARHFKQNKSFTLGLIIPDLLDQFYILGINGVEEVAACHRYSVIISQTHEDATTEAEIVNLMIRNRVDGVIVTITKNTTDMAPFHKLLQNGIPVVFFSRAPTQALFDYVAADNLDGALQAVDFLYQRGHKRIAHLMGPPAMPVSLLRKEGYQMALAEKGISYDPALVKETDFTADSTNKAMQSLMDVQEPPTAIFVFKNYVSLEVIRYLKKHHPGKLNKVDLAGFGNLPLLQYLDYKPLASIEENAHLMGIEAAKLLLKKIALPPTEEKNGIQHIKVPCRLIVHD